MIAPGADQEEGSGPPGEGPLGHPQRELIGLLVVLSIIGYLLLGFSQAYDVARRVDPFGRSSTIDWQAFLEAASLYANYVVALLMVVGFLLVSGRSYGESRPTARAATLVLFPIGIVISLGAVYAIVQLLGPQSAEPEGTVIVGRASDWPQRIGGAASYLVTACLAMYLAWCAYVRLPISQRRAEDADPDPVEGDAPER